jgi:DNA-binding CsgD family transcriptional regulator
VSEATAVARPSTLVEREEELATLGALLDAMQGGIGRVAVVEGAEGIGKTRLLEALRHDVESRGIRALSARGAELERGFPFGIVRQLFEPLTSAGSHHERAALRRGAARLAAPVLMEPAAGTVDLEEPPFATLHGLYWLTANLCDREPLALLIDDAHWSDEPSVRFLGYLQRRLADLPLLLTIAMRPQEHRTDSSRLAEIAADESTVTLRLRPLTSAGCGVLVRCAWPEGVDDAFCDACHEATGGNPFLLTELIGELRRQGVASTAAEAEGIRDVRPASIARVLLVRLARLPADAVKLAQAIAVLGDGVELRHAARLARLSIERAAELAGVLAGVDLIANERSLRFAHPLVRASVYAELAPWEASRMHRRAARLLAADSASVDRVASHLLLSDPAGNRWTVAVLGRAATAAAARGAPEAAVAYLSRALAEPVTEDERPAVLRELGSAEVRTGSSNGLAHLREAFALSRGPQDVATAARALAVGLTVSSESVEAFGVMERAIEQVGDSDPDLALALEAELAAHTFLDPSLALTARRRLEQLGEIKGAGLGAQWARAAQAFYRSRSAPTAAQAGALLTDALQVDRLAGEGGLHLDGPRYLLVIGLLSVDRLDTLDRLFEEARIHAGAHGSMLGFALISALHAHLSFRRGDVAAAEEDALRALELFATHGWPVGRPFALAFLVDPLTERGAFEEADRRLEDAGALGPLPTGTGEELLLASRARLRLSQGRPAEALADLEELREREEASGLAYPLARRHRAYAALALAALGDAPSARAVAAEDLRLARAWGAPRDVGVALRAAGLVEGGEEGRRLLREAVAVLADSPARLELARALTDLGAALRRSNRRSEARDPLRQALDLTHRCRAVVLAQQAREELAATGARPRTLVLTGLDSLTASERRVAHLAANRLSNPEIAQALFVTRKTVEKHLSNVYMKLGVPRREDLPAALAEQ